MSTTYAKRTRTMIMAVVAVMSLVAPALFTGVAWGGANPFVGEIEIVAFTYAPVGWATCDGQLLSISENAALFALLGTTYGGDGATTFALPDLRGRVAIHQGQGTGLTHRFMGEMEGSEEVTLTTSQMPAHTHTATTGVTVTSTLHAQSGLGLSRLPTGNVLAATRVFQPHLYSAAAPNVSMNAGAITSNASAATTIGSSGSGQPVHIMPPYLVVNYIISLLGVFPAHP